MPVYNGPLLSHRISNLRRNKEYRFRVGLFALSNQSSDSDVSWANYCVGIICIKYVHFVRSCTEELHMLINRLFS